MLLGDADTHRDVIYGAHTTNGIIAGSVFPIRSVRTETHKYIRNLNHGGEFTNIMTHPPEGNPHEDGRLCRSWVEKAKSDDFAAQRVALHQRRPAEGPHDLRADPWELTNLADDPTHALTALRALLDDWMAQQSDAGLDAELAVPPRQS